MDTYRIAYRIHAIPGNTEAKELKKQIKKYGPDKVRKEHHLTYGELYASLIDCYQEQLAFQPTEYAKYVFQNNYIYNDSRMEGLEVTQEQAAEIVADIRLNAQNSQYCSEENEAYLSIAGHYAMYQDIFAIPVKEKISVYDIISLNKKLFSYYPNPDFGGSIRQNNTLVLGAKFETVDYHMIYAELMLLPRLRIPLEYFQFNYTIHKSMKLYIFHHTTSIMPLNLTSFPLRLHLPGLVLQEIT